MTQQSNNISTQLARVADELKNVANRLEKITTGGQSRGRGKELAEEEVKEKLTTQITDNLTAEARLILETAIDQISGTKPEDLNPDQLYGWTDSLQKVMGLTASAPTSEVRIS